MTDYQVAFWLIFMGIIEILAVGAAIFFVFPSENKMHWLLKTGFAFMVFGLLVQVVRSTHYLHVGSYPIDHIFPMWLTKDIGASLLITYYAFVYHRENK